MEFLNIISKAGISRGASRRGRVAAAWVLLLLGLVTFGRGGLRPAEAQAYTELDIKAAFIFKFTKFVEWPEPKKDPAAPAGNPGETFSIGLIGDPRLRESLKTLTKQQQVQGQPVEVEESAEIERLLLCEVLYLDKAEPTRGVQLLEQLGGRAMLTITDHPDLFDQGAVICLEKQENRFQFRVNQEAAQQAGLKLSSQLLKLAKEIRKAPSAEELEAPESEVPAAETGNSPP